ncbi:MAG: hypothetical protein ACXVPU_12025 [Bacteroidia bacterium]
MRNNSDYIFEAEQITNYLLSVPVQENEKNNYADAMQKLNIQFSEYENALWESMLKSKWRMASIDAGLALKEPNNNVRRKLFIMLAILEASPNYTSYFLSEKYSFFYMFKLISVGIRAVWRAMIGILIVKNIKRKCN